MILAAFLIGVVLPIIGLVVVSSRGVALWRQGKRTGKTFTSELALFDERSARTEQLLADSERANQDLQEATERLRVSRAQLQVLVDSLESARRSTRWLRVFLPTR